MKKIKSFTINHDILNEGIYFGGANGDVDTYDLRVTKPNVYFMDIAAMHSIEHLFATFARDRYKEHIIYFGPMGCRTGFYLLTRGLDPNEVICLINETFRFIADFEGELPGNTSIECGNFREHDVKGAKDIAVKYLKVIDGYTSDRLIYPVK